MEAQEHSRSATQREQLQRQKRHQSGCMKLLLYNAMNVAHDFDMFVRMLRHTYVWMYVGMHECMYVRMLRTYVCLDVCRYA